MKDPSDFIPSFECDSSVEEILETIRDLLEPGKTIFYNDGFEVETMQRDALGYCLFTLHSVIWIS